MSNNDWKWLLVCLLIIILFLITQRFDGDKAVQFISLAAAITSIVLAMLAIVYAFIVNTDFNRTLQRISSTSEILKGISENLAKDVGGYSEKVDHLPSTISRILENRMDSNPVEPQTDDMIDT
ncbi:hypothetical protein ACFLQV_04455, partial [Calditrichota bacterium]